MTYTGLELFMENLKQLSYNNDYPLINNNPEILSERPQIQLLYEELSNMIQIMFVGEQNNNLTYEIEQLKSVKTRFKDVAQEAHSIVGLFVYSINYTNTTHPHPPPSRYEFIEDILFCMKVKRSVNNKCSLLNLENVMRDMKSIKEEFIMILDSLKMESSPSVESLRMQSVIDGGGSTSGARNPLGTKNVILEGTVVGLDHDAKLVMDKLVEDQKQLDVVSIVGMGGLGKTTLATKVFNDPFVVYHFHIRVWVTVSQTYEKRDLLIQILAFVGIRLDSKKVSYSKLREVLHKRLMGNRYLIVVDDIWNIEAWDDLKLCFPNNYTGSRILITSRLKDVVLHAKSNGFVHHLECLTHRESWELLCKKVFHGNNCPESLIKPGVQIAKNCHGLPLAVVVIAGVLAKVAADEDSWEIIGERVSSYIVNDENRYLDILGLSYEHLPPHLKDCFLYLGLSGFPDHHKFRLRKLIWLWIAEGFVQEDGNRSLEEIGEDYLMELVNRNLVAVVDRKCNGAIKACSVHDLLRELCLERATKGNFCMKISKGMSSFHSERRYKPRRIFTYRNFLKNNFVDQPSPWVHSLLCFSSYFFYTKITKGYFHSNPLLTVLDLEKCRLEGFPQSIGLLVHLRYLAFWCEKGFPSSICNLWSLHTLIAKSYDHLHVPKVISNLVNLRHLWIEGVFYFPSLKKPMHLQTISYVTLGDKAKSWEKYFPCIKKLTCMTSTQKNDFKSLNCLETLTLISRASYGSQVGDCVLTYGGKFKTNYVTFPASLKKLSLVGCCLPWNEMAIIQSLPNLEVLKILSEAFVGPIWEVGETQFRQLNFLKLQGLDIRQWEASSINFPCLKHLVLDKCNYLEEIPLEIGDISTLELIDVDNCSRSVVESLDKIREEQQNFGNYDLRINVRKEFCPDRVNKKLQALVGTTRKVPYRMSRRSLHNF